MKTYNLEPNTVKILKNGMLRVGQDLLGTLAGNRDLVFDMKFDDNGRLVMRPQTKGPGWPATYSSPDQKSPMVSIGMFYRVNKRKPPCPGTTVMCSRRKSGDIIVDFKQNGTSGS